METRLTESRKRTKKAATVPAKAKKRKIGICVPCYSGKPELEHVYSINQMKMECLQNGWDYYPLDRHQDSVLARARNVLASMVFEAGCDDMMFVDADIACRPGSFTQLMKHDVDLVGGAYRARQDPEEYVFRSLRPEGVVVNPENKLMEVDSVPTGFMRIRRAVWDRMKEAAPDYWYSDCTVPGLTVWNFFDFQFRINTHEYWTEDYVFCNRWRELGGKCWLDPWLTLDHIGRKVFSGCLMDFLMNSPAVKRFPLGDTPPAVAAPPTTLSRAKALLKDIAA
jgi:hypothetical protein